MRTDAELLERNLGLMRWAIRKTAPGRDTGEFLGVAYEALRRSRASFDAPRGTWEALLIKCVTNAVRDALKSERRHRRHSEPVGDRDLAGIDPAPPDLLAARDDIRLLADALARIGEERGPRRGHVAALMARGVPLRKIGPVIGCTSPSGLHKHSEASIEDLADFLGSERTSRIDRRSDRGPATRRFPKCKMSR